MLSRWSIFALAVLAFTAVRGVALPAEPVHTLSKRVVYNCSDTEKLAIISAAYNSGKAMAADARNYINSHGASDSLVKTYFGNDTGLIPHVTWLYNQIANEAGTNYTLTCDYDPSGACDGGTVVARNNYLRNASRTEFYQRLPMSCSTRIDSMNGSREDTIVHEMSHALGRTTDYNGSCSSSRTLALTNATAAVNHAYAYGCFVMEVYKVLHC
ncbi:hypothetical protein VNI00_004138 [Paramarasmius palmivorus]|uniref:Lysine-specific metallo-endopeptidase domain-containing protein n=1 Tax=Paramarasmius palmivorus TaxID=297713 RepID=A0AAW0DPM7_9AGAR